MNEPDDRFDDEMREQREEEHSYRCAMRDMDQGIDPNLFCDDDNE